MGTDVHGHRFMRADHRLDITVLTQNTQGMQVVIVGGGLAGLYAALQLERVGIAYVLLEAQPRLGGRILSLPISDKGTGSGVRDVGVDLGPTWFWPHQQRMIRLCRDMGVQVIEQHVAGDVLHQHSSAQVTRQRSGAPGMLSYRLAGGMQTLATAIAARLEANERGRGRLRRARNGEAIHRRCALTSLFFEIEVPPIS